MHTDDTFWALQHFKGKAYCELLYSDDAKQIRKASRSLRIPWDHAQAGVSRTNAIAESLVGSQCDAIRALMVIAGLPACFWPFVGVAMVMFRNTSIHDDGASAWYERFGSHFEGLRVLRVL